jgi:hypothetical protein
MIYQRAWLAVVAHQKMCLVIEKQTNRSVDREIKINESEKK